MSVTSIDTNAYYYIEAAANDGFLTWNTSSSGTNYMDLFQSTTVNWQFLDVGEANGGDSTGYYLMRPAANPGYCMDATNGIVLDICSSSTTQWQASSSSDGSVWYIYIDTSDYLAAGGASSDSGVRIVTNTVSPENAVNAQFALSSASAVNDESWSTLPYATSTTTTSSTTTTTSDDESYTSTTSDYYYTETTTSAAAITTSPTATYGDYPSSPSSTWFSESIVDKSVADLGAIPAAFLLPPHSNVGCENCSISGYAGVAAGGCETTADSWYELEQCESNGYVDISLSEIRANMSLDVQFLPGFSLVDTFLSFVNVSLGSVAITEKLSLNFTLNFGIPFSVTLESPVTVNGGFLFELPDANFRFDLNDLASSQPTGFDEAFISPLPFHVSDPNLTLEFMTGLALRIHCAAIAEAEEVEVDGILTFELGVPRVNITTVIESETVDDNCNPTSGSGGHHPAVNLYYDVEAGVYVRGSLEVHAGEYINAKWDSDEVSPWTYPIKRDSTCLYASLLEAEFLQSGLGSRTRSEVGWWWLGTILTSLTLWAL